MIAREEARLRAVFERLLVLSMAAAPLACSTSGDAPGADAGAPSSLHPGDAGGAGLDATIASDDAAKPPDPDSGPGLYDASDGACDPVFLDGSTDDGGCDFRETLPCGLPQGTATEGCYLALTTCAVLCGQAETLQRTCAISECLTVDASTIPSTTPLTLECATGAPGCGQGAGRRPEGLVPAEPARHADAVGRALADLARLEAASIPAFRRLASELASMRAPRRLVRAAERAARDEVRHARVMARIARRHGAAPAPVTIARRPRARSLEAFAVENVVEGCVRECFGALVAMRQVTLAPDPRLARAMKRIARDETRHAALAWMISRWVEPRLSRAARARARRAMAEAIAVLRREVESTPADLARALGTPAGPEGAALVDAFREALVATI